MRFRSPIDDVQWTAAAKSHAQMRRSLLAVRRDYPPRSKDERALLKRYRDSIQEYARHLSQPRGRISGRRLNALSDRAVEAFVAYLALRSGD